MRDRTALTPETFSEIVRTMDISLDNIDRWRRQIEAGDRQAYISYGHDGKRYISMQYTPRDSSEVDKQMLQRDNG